MNGMKWCWTLTLLVVLAAVFVAADGAWAQEEPYRGPAGEVPPDQYNPKEPIEPSEDGPPRRIPPRIRRRMTPSVRSSSRRGTWTETERTRPSS
jgi:hypothetical protein